MRRAEFSVGYMYIIGGVIAALIVIAYFTGVFPWVLEKVGLVELIPVLGLTEPVQGNGVVGVNIASGNLEYYTGESFKKFTGQEVALIGGYEFNVKDVQGKISDFYFNTQRRPEKLVMEINHWRYWDVTMGQSDAMSFIVNFENKDIFEKDGLPESYEYAELDSYGKPKIFSSYEPKTFPNFAKLEFEANKDKVSQMVDWRDSILQGNKCEKFLTLKLKKNENDVDMIYTVRKVDGYLVVDLTKSVASGMVEKWIKTNCFEFDSYIDNEQINLALLGVHFTYQEEDVNIELANRASPTLQYTGKNGGWYYHGNNPEASYYYRVLDIKKSLYDNLIQITRAKNFIGEGWFGIDKYDEGGLFEKFNIMFKSGDVRQGVFVSKGVYLSNHVSTLDLGFIRDKEWSKLTIDERNKFIYDLLGEFYRLSILEGVVQNV